MTCVRLTEFTACRRPTGWMLSLVLLVSGAGGANLPPAGEMRHHRGEDLQSLQEEDRKQVRLC